MDLNIPVILENIKHFLENSFQNSLFELGVFLLFLALAALLASKLKFPIVPALIIIGIILPPTGFIPYTPGETTMSQINFLGEIGVLFLLLSLGLEFSIKKLLESARTILKSGVIYVGILGTASVIFAFCMRWSLAEILLVFGIIIISSSAIVAKSLVDLKRTANPETETILGLMLFQDIFMAIFLPVVSAIVLTQSGSPLQLATSVGFAFLFIVAFIFFSLKTSILERLFNIISDEVFLLTILAVLIVMAGTSKQLEISDAIGALILGMVLAETSHQTRILHMIVPFRDFFGAAFFFGFGLNISLSLESVQALPVVLIGVGLTLVGSLVYGIVMSRVAGISKRGAVNLGLTITSRGEFSIVLLQLGVVSTAFKSFAELFVVFLAIAGPLLTRFSDTIYMGLAKVFHWKYEPKKKKHHRPVKAKSEQ